MLFYVTREETGRKSGRLLQGSYTLPDFPSISSLVSLPFQSCCHPTTAIPRLMPQAALTSWKKFNKLVSLQWCRSSLLTFNMHENGVMNMGGK